MEKDSKFTRDDEGYVAVRVVTATEELPASDPDSMFGRDTNGNIAVRVVGTGGGGGVDESKVIVLSATIPTADASNLGKFYCYKGTTNATYTHGYVYECVEGSVSYEANIAFERGTFASEDFEKAGKLIVDAGVADPTEVTGGTMTYALAGNIWSIVFTDANGNALNTAYNLYTEDLEQDYDILPVIDPREFIDGQVVGMAINNVVKTVDYAWERVDLQPAANLGKYLAGWNCSTGLAMTNPPQSPYTYTTGDYFIVGVVATGGASNYRPNGSSYITGEASSTVETEEVNVNDTYFYDGTSWTLLRTGASVTSVNGQTGAVTVQETLVSGTNIKSINGNSILGAGNLQVSGFLPFPAGWTTNSTTKALCDDIAADTTTVKGSAFLGEVTCSDLPAGIVNSEINVYINDGTTAANKVIILELTSGNVAPYRWIYVYWNGGTDTSGWQTWQETLVSGTNIKTINGESLLGSGNLSVGGIPQYTTMPTATSSNVGEIAQYSGTTDANYTNGYFYKCVSDGENPATYSWTRIDVQPAGSGGGIEWAASIDKPANHSSSYYRESPVWVISGGLPDGEYEFCFQTLVSRDKIDSEYPNGYNQYVTYKARFAILTISGKKYVQGNLAYVIDGDWVVNNSEYNPQNSYIYYFLKIYGNDMIINYNGVPFNSAITGEYFAEEVKNIFKITSIKNINTGEEYIPTGHLYDWANNEESNWTQMSSCVLYTSNLVTIPEEKVYNNTLYVGWSSGSYNCLVFSNPNQIVGYPWTFSDSEPKASEVDFVITSTLGGKYHAVIENSSNSYTARILEASGDLANLKLLTQDGRLGACFNFATTDDRSLKATLGLKGSKVEATCDWDYSNIVQNWEEIVFDTVGAEITLKNFGVVAQYNGEIPNIAYTKGCFYQATGTVVTVPDDITCEEVTTSTGSTITCLDANGFINALINEFGVTRDDILYWFSIGYNRIEYQVGASAYWNTGYWIPESIITTYFSFSPALQTGVDIYWLMTLTPEHQEVQNPAWVRYNTQPATTGTTGTLVVADWSSSTQTITVNGVTASNNILVSPAPASATDWASAGILCTAQSTDSLTFTCQTTPSNDITVNVAILN